MRPDRPFVSVVMVTWNCRSVVGRSLASLAAAATSTPFEVVVVDNASSDGTPAAVGAASPAARVIVNVRNRGLAAANNQGIRHARGELLLITNPDMVWSPGAVDALVAGMERHPRAAWVVPRLLYEDGAVQTSAGDLPDLAGALLGRQFQRRRAARSGGATSGTWWDGWAHDEERQIGRGHEAGYLVRRDAVEEVGMQDEGYRLDWEGVEWTARFRQAGWEIWFCPDAEAVHVGGVSIRQVPFRWIVSSHRGMYRYFSRGRGALTRAVLAGVVSTRAVMKLAVAGVGWPLYERAHRRRPDARGRGPSKAGRR